MRQRHLLKFGGFLERQYIYHTGNIQVKSHPTMKMLATGEYCSQFKIALAEYMDQAVAVFGGWGRVTTKLLNATTATGARFCSGAHVPPNKQCQFKRTTSVGPSCVYEIHRSGGLLHGWISKKCSFRMNETDLKTLTCIRSTVPAREVNTSVSTYFHDSTLANVSQLPHTGS